MTLPLPLTLSLPLPLTLTLPCGGMMVAMAHGDTISALEQRLATHLGEGGDAGVISVYLFGSRAEGRAHRDSDTDVGVLLDRALLPGREARFDASLRLGARLAGVLAAERVDVVVLNDAPPLLARRIVTRGRRVYCVDLEIDHAFVRDVQLRAADLKPFLDRMQRIKLEALSPR